MTRPVFDLRAYGAMLVAVDDLADLPGPPL
jgi:hypothetical protein